MDWKDFKKRVDTALKEKGIDESTEIWYIDCGTMLREEDENSPSVGIDDDMGISISD